MRTFDVIGATATNLAIQTLVRALPILVLALLAMALLRNASAAKRHLVLSIAMGSLLLLPLLVAFLPHWNLPWAFAIPKTPKAPIVQELSPKVETDFLPVQPLSTKFEAPLTVGVAAPVPPPPAAIAERPSTIQPELILQLAWLGGVLVLGVRQALSLWTVWSYGRRCRRANEQIASSLGVKNSNIHVLLGGPNSTPMTWGLVRPTLLFPEGALSWPPERRQSVVLHELAHIERGDWTTQWVSEIVCVLYWFVPLTWLAAKRMRLESERAADDRVLAAGFEAPTYAEHVLQVLREMRPSVKPLAATVPMARPSQIHMRLSAILQTGIRRQPLSKSAILTALMIGGTGVVAIASVQGAIGEAKRAAASRNQTNENDPIQLNVSAAKYGFPSLETATNNLHLARHNQVQIDGGGSSVTVDSTGVHVSNGRSKTRLKNGKAEVHIVDKATNSEVRIDKTGVHIRDHGKSVVEIDAKGVHVNDVGSKAHVRMDSKGLSIDDGKGKKVEINGQHVIIDGAEISLPEEARIELNQQIAEARVEAAQAVKEQYQAISEAAKENAEAALEEQKERIEENAEKAREQVEKTRDIDQKLRQKTLLQAQKGRMLAQRVEENAEKAREQAEKTRGIDQKLRQKTLLQAEKTRLLAQKETLRTLRQTELIRNKALHEAEIATHESEIARNQVLHKAEETRNRALHAAEESRNKALHAAEDARNQALHAAEEARKQADQARKQAEEARKQAEKAKEQAERDRDKNGN